jgi:serine beta-lactamase-like protein LACTB
MHHNRKLIIAQTLFNNYYEKRAGKFRATLDKMKFFALAIVFFSRLYALSPERILVLEKALEAEREHQGIVGMSAAIVVNRELQWTHGFGQSDLENNVPARAATMYRLGSIAKPITAAAVMQLVEKGAIDLDEPIQRYVPGFPRKQWVVTVRQLLGHLGGIRTYQGDEMGSTRHYGSVIEPLNIFKDDPLAVEPGTRYLYSTYGFNLLGAAVEQASGMAFTDYLRTKIFTPAKIEFIVPDNTFAIIPNRTRGYMAGAGGKLENAILADTSNKIPGGGLMGTAEDVARFASALANGLLVTPASLELMSTSLKLKDGTQTGYGLGLGLGKHAGHRTFSHEGGQPGTRTIMAILPDDRVTIAIMTNTETAKQAALLEVAIRALFD